MGKNCAEDPFNMGMFYNSRSHSKWVYFQILNIHIPTFYIGVAPPPPGSQDHISTGRFSPRKSQHDHLVATSGHDIGAIDGGAGVAILNLGILLSHCRI